MKTIVELVRANSPTQAISGVPWIRFSSGSLVGCVLASRVACFVYGHHICRPSQLAFGGDDHRRCEKNDYGAEDQESCRVRRRHHIVESWLIEPSKLAWKIATSSTLLLVRL